MGWRRPWPDREPRPKLKRLSKEQKDRILKSINLELSSSPVMVALNSKIRVLRGRFYVEKPIYIADEEDEKEIIARITPIEGKKNPLLLDAKKADENWYEITRGSIKKVVDRIINDKRGTFHGLGALDDSLRKTEGSQKQNYIEMRENLKFVYLTNGEECTAQEALYFFFGIPIPLIAEPREYYLYNRNPKIIDVNKERTKVIVEFTKLDMYFGRKFGDTCMYKKEDGKWDIYE
jgi:hypothetical protein